MTTTPTFPHLDRAALERRNEALIEALGPFANWFEDLQAKRPNDWQSVDLSPVGMDINWFPPVVKVLADGIKVEEKW